MEDYKIKAIIFDYDGVIVDSFKGIFEVYKIICKECGVASPGEIEEFRKKYGYSYVECRQNLGIKESDFDKAQEIFNREIIKQNHNIFKNLDKVIVELNRRYKLFLVSAASDNEVLKNLDKFNLTRYFEKVYCTSGKIYGKGGIIKNILEKNNLLKDEIVSIGDRTLDYDVAKKLGLADANIIITAYGWGFDKKRVKIDNIVNSPEDILEIIRHLN